MFLKRRNILGWVLILAAALLWTLGQGIQEGVFSSIGGTAPTTYPTTAPTTAVTIDPTTETTIGSSSEFTTDTTLYHDFIVDDPEPEAPRITGRTWSIILCVASVVLAILGIFWAEQKQALLGPDGTALVLSLPFQIPNDYFAYGAQYLLRIFLTVLIVLVCARELWGWIRSRCSLDRCLCHRIAAAVRQPQVTLLVLAGWIGSCAACAVYIICRYYYVIHPAAWLLFTVGGCFGIACLWRYGLQLAHYDRQLRNFQEGLPIEVREGAFQDAEARLQTIQRQHEEAIHTAVTSERFKVELISNVSHDLRTPLTSILGYSELLDREDLSPEGREQLRRLHLKAGYMNDLVEALFELTKVSSGVVESKQESIDLIRLLEQTIGLFDDQLTAANLTVRRHYQAESVPVLTDGSRMHQVFANLLGNAIKYALPGTRIHLEVREEAVGFRVRITNIASYEMDFQPEEILQRFARGDKARSTKGSGLGLAIAQTYTESVGGQFRVAVDGDQFSAIVELPKL